MSNKTVTLQAEPTKSSTFRKMIQAAALAAVLVPLGSVAVEAVSITCGFGGTEGYGGSYCNAQQGEDFFSATATTSRFDFGDYYFELTFVLVPGAEFDVTVNTTPSTVLDGESFPGYECIELTAGDGCVDFQVVTTGEVGTHWTHYEVEINWLNWEGEQALEESRMRMLHDSSLFDGAEAPGTYDFDMCITPGYDACVAETSPLIRSGDTDFDSFMAVLSPATQAVPEPSSLILLATGVGGALLRRRRRT